MPLRGLRRAGRATLVAVSLSVAVAPLQARDAPSSQHIQGKAIDVRLKGVDTERLRDLARALKRGGVGYYPKSEFVHVDTAQVRYWEG